MNWYLKVLKQYANFNGRARRKEFWVFAFFNVLFLTMIMIVENNSEIIIEGIGYGPVSLIYALAILVPGLAVFVRRLHDVGRSGWMMLLVFIPIVGAMYLFMLLVSDSDTEQNKYVINSKMYSGKRMNVS